VVERQRRAALDGNLDAIQLGGVIDGTIAGNVDHGRDRRRRSRHGYRKFRICWTPKMESAWKTNET
jgi:hypothetical protein